MKESDLRETLSVMRRAAEASRARKHDVEAAMGLSHGRLEDLWAGVLEVKLRHLVGLAELIDVPPAEIVAAGCPRAQAASHRLADWIGPVEPPLAKKRAPEGAAPAVSVAIEDERLRRLIREELAAALAKKPAQDG
ncbi:MAG TPA: hypothetical protein VN783_05915 [Thermoanaerobaculia bacterium]|nr:hypothetical protein [Thermoanaerobaculia bacterium]